MTVCSAAFPVNGEVGLYDKLIRLHVLANSDDEEDQALKLKVRDAVLAYTEDIVSVCKDVTQAKTAIENSKNEIQKGFRSESYGYADKQRFGLWN